MPAGSYVTLGGSWYEQTNTTKVTGDLNKIKLVTMIRGY